MDKKKKNSGEGTGQPKVYGDPVYGADEDIYSKGKKEDLEDSGEGLEIGKGKGNRAPGAGDDLDVPGSELDDQDEEIGEEDEENDYYSLGGDDHDDLEDDKGD